MSDINLLPINQRRKEEDEYHKKILAKTKMDIKLTNPHKQSQVMDEKSEETSGISAKLKDFFNKITGKTGSAAGFFKSKKQQPEKAVLSVGGEQLNQSLATGHMDDIHSRGVQKSFSYQTPNAAVVVEPILVKVKNGVTPTGVEIKTDKNNENELKPTAIKESESGDTVNLLTPVKESFYQPQNRQKKERLVNQDAELVRNKKVEINLMPTHVKAVSSVQQKLKTYVFVVVGCVLLVVLTYVTLNQAVAGRGDRVQELEVETQMLLDKVTELRSKTVAVNGFIDVLKEAKEVISSHVFVTNVFDFLEKNTLTQIYYSGLQAEVSSWSVDLTVKAKDYKTLAQQLYVFQTKEKYIQDIKINGVQTDVEGESENKDEIPQNLVEANVTLVFKPEIFHLVKKD